MIAKCVRNHNVTENIFPQKRRDMVEVVEYNRRRQQMEMLSVIDVYQQLKLNIASCTNKQLMIAIFMPIISV